MQAPYLSELRIFPYSNIPGGWMPCNGQLLKIAQNTALFAVIGVAYGGDGVTTFGLPDLRGRVPMCAGQFLKRGEMGGEETHHLTINEIPNHKHLAIASSALPDNGSPVNNYWTQGNGHTQYGMAQENPMSSKALAIVGNDAPHNNMAPYLVFGICIAVFGLFPE